MSNPHFHLDILRSQQEATLKLLAPLYRYGILAGGTALALQLGHRKSYDFDFFTTKPISKIFVRRVKDTVGSMRMLVDTGDELSFISSHNIKVSFVYYPFPPLYDYVALNTLRISLWKDIALDKAHTIGRRGEWRDYIDLYFIVRDGFSLSDIVGNAKKKFGDLFSEKLFLSQLCYLEDIKDFSIELVGEDVSPRYLQQFFESEAEKIV